MKKQAYNVHYQHPELGNVMIERLQRDEVDYQLAQQVRHLIGTSYAREFESPRTPRDVRLPHGRISDAYLVDNAANIEMQRIRIERALASGSSYWLTSIAHPGRQYGEDWLDGLAKTTPSRGSLAQKLHLSDPNCYVDDIIVRPASEQFPRTRGIGSMLLYTALQHDRYKPSAVVVADTYRSGHSGPQFFDEVGFELQRNSTPPATVFNRGEDTEIHLPMDRREAEIAAVTQRLIAKFEWLETAEVAYNS